MKIVSIEEVKQRIEVEYPNQPYEIITYTGMTKPFSIKCLKCNNIFNYSSTRNFLQKGHAIDKKRQFLCKCYNENNSYNKHKNNEQIIMNLYNNQSDIDFMAFGYKDSTKKYTVTSKCNKCNQLFTKSWQDFINNQTCPFCMSKHDLNTEGFKTLLPSEYTLLNSYNGTENKVLIKHECGFIWKVRPHTLIQKINNGYSGCPKCNHKRSNGELRIAKWLENHNISFIEEHSFMWQSNLQFRYDFYLPEYNLIIEYMGKQHYEEVEFFHDTLQERQEHDKIKQIEAEAHKLHYLVIPYTDFKNIETILTDWFNDYSERKQNISD